MPDMAMSNLSAARSASMVPNVIFTYSILTPSAAPRLCSASMSKPSSWPSLRMLNTGVSMVVPTRRVPRLSTMSSRSAACPKAGRAAASAMMEAVMNVRKFMDAFPVSRARVTQERTPFKNLRAGGSDVCSRLQVRGEIMNPRLATLFCSILLAALLAPTHAPAQKFPDHPVKFIVPFPGGGINDVLARIVGDKLSARWGQPIVVEKRTGAGGNIGAEVAAQAEPDGYTLLVSPPGPLAINQTLYKRLSYKPDEFVPITVLGAVPNVAIARKELPVNSLQELIAY